MDANDSAAQAMAIRRGVIVKVGTDADVLAEQIKNLKCLMTLLDGEVVHTSHDSSVTTEVR